MRGIGKHRTLKIAAAALLSVAVLLGGPARAQAQQDSVAQFYKGKTIRLAVGAAAGAAYDFMARVLAAHYGKYIPGNPSFVVENMPGAGSIVMLNYLAVRAPQDGTVIGLSLGGVIHEPRLNALSRDGRNVQFDATKLGWLGSPAQQPLIYVVWHQTPFQTFADIQKQEATFATTSRSGDNFVIPVFTNQALGTKLKLVQGYKGVNDIFHAMEQGEVQGTGMILASLLAKQDWIRDKKARVLMQFGATRNRLIPDVPTAIEVLQDEKAKQMLRIYAQKYATTYPFMLPSGVPPERLRALQQAFDAAMKDEALIADARKFGIDIDPVSGAEIEKIVAEVAKLPPDVVEQLRGLINPP
jgi:tripartite-type tricarboxylate transporter receptor subunit TctC